jgi:hypothetical protein
MSHPVIRMKPEESLRRSQKKLPSAPTIIYVKLAMGLLILFAFIQRQLISTAIKSARIMIDFTFESISPSISTDRRGIVV